ncbi:MAG: GNAT family protein [Dehalococcoidia bacterium]|nr:GNAT family protein [Dehalococcoidia bacterium]
MTTQGSRAATYDLIGYPTVRLTSESEEFGVRPMESDDSQALLEFFNRVPEDDRYYLKEDVTSPAVIERWCEELDYHRVIPLIATKGDRIIGDATLHRSRSTARCHVADIRVVVDPEYRNKGVGRVLLRSLGDVAHQSDILRLRFEIVAGREEPARRTALALGFVPVAALPDYIRDSDGTLHDLLIMDLRVSALVSDTDMEIL